MSSARVRSCPFGWRRGEFAVERSPSGARLAAGDEFHLYRFVSLSGVEVLGAHVVSGNDDALYLRGVASVDIVLRHQHRRRKDHHRAEFVQPEQQIPEVVVTLQDQQYPVALADTCVIEEPRGSVRLARHLAETDRLLGAVSAEPLQRPLVRALASQHVEHVIGEVEVFRIVYSIVFLCILQGSETVSVPSGESFVNSHMGIPVYQFT